MRSWPETRSDIELLRLCRLAGEYDQDGARTVLDASRKWIAGELADLTSVDTAFLTEALFKCGRLTEAAAVTRKRLAQGESPTAFDDFATQYQRLAAYDFALPGRNAAAQMFMPAPHSAKLRVLSLYHSSSTFQHSGYTVRTQAILANSQLDVAAMTRAGYPWAAGLAKAALAKVDKNSFESTSGTVKYRHRRGQVTNQSWTFSNIALGKHEIVKAIGEHRPSVVHAASNFVNALPALLAARMCGLPFVYEMRGLWELTAGVGVAGWLESERYLLERRIETFVARNADMVIVLSEVQKRELLERGIEAKRIQVVINGYEPRQLSLERKTSLLDENCPGLTEWVAGRTVIGYAGAIAVYEGLQDLVAAVASRRDAWRHVALVIAGDGPYLSQLRGQIAALGLENQIRLLGRVPGEAVDGLYDIFDLCVLPRLPDLVSQLITPQKTVEILAHGKVLLASNVDAMAEQLRSYGYGETFVAGDRQDLERQLDRVLDELPALKQHYAGASARIAKRFSWAAIASEWDRALRKVVSLTMRTRAKVKPARAALGPLYDEAPQVVLDPLKQWRRVARASVTLSASRKMYLRVPADFGMTLELCVVTVPHDGEIGVLAKLGAPLLQGRHLWYEIPATPEGKCNLLLYLERGKAGRVPAAAFGLMQAQPGEDFPDLNKASIPLKPEVRDTLAFTFEHDVTIPTRLSVLSKYPGATRFALSYIPLSGATLSDNFVRRTKSKDTGTRFEYVTVQQGKSELDVFPRAVGPLLAELTPWVQGQTLENQLHQVAKVKYYPRDGSYYPVLDRSRVNVLIAADLNETLLDGSTIWLKTLAGTLADAEGVNVYVATNAVDVSNGVTSELFALPNVAKIDLPPAPGERGDLGRKIVTLDRTSGGFDLIIVRGIDLAKTVVDRSTRDRVVYYGVGMFKREPDGGLFTDESALGIAAKSAGVIFQNSLMESMFRERVPDYPGTCFCLSPCVDGGALAAARNVALPRISRDEELVVYAGKLIREYGVVELLDAVRKRLAAGHRTRLVILGNKFDGREPGYQVQFEKALAKLGDAVTWLPAVPPATVLAWVARADAVWGWRHGEFENAHFEISTKMVEAITCSTPIVLYPSAANKDLMGKGYAGFGAKPRDATAALGRLLARGRVGFKPTAARLRGRFHAREVYQPLLKYATQLRMRQKQESTGGEADRQTILVAAHDFKFFEDIEASLLREGHSVIREYWKNHTTRYVYGQADAANSADAVFCEWCLGNAVWWSNNLPAGKRLFIRMHRQELETPHPGNVNFSCVEKIIFISAHVMQQAIAKFHIPPDKCQVIPISVRLNPGRPRTAVEVAARRNVLGMIGITPWLKRPDRALQLLQQLRRTYPDVTLHLKGHTPSEYSWMSGRKEELAKYQAFFREVASLERQGIVRFSGFDNELEKFYRSVGWILSLSDLEGCHTAVAEGGCMGCLPLMTNWGGADAVYPPELVQPDLEQVSRYFAEHYAGFAKHSLALQGQFQSTFSIDAVFEAWRALLLREPQRMGKPSASVIQ